MTRLFDADKVISLWDKYHYSIATHAIEFDEELRKLPTVEAIPIEWIKKYTEENRLYQSDDFDLYISDMIADWAERKEE